MKSLLNMLTQYCETAAGINIVIRQTSELIGGVWDAPRA